MSSHIIIVTLNWNRCDDTLDFLYSCQQLNHPIKQIVVVDNGSSDNSVEQISRIFPNVYILRNTQNRGFAFAANQGMLYALEQGATCIFLANNDTTLAHDMMGYLVNVMEEIHADIVAPTIFSAYNPHAIWSLGGYRRRLTLEIDYHRYPLSATMFTTDFVTGCGMLVHRRCIERIGLFDDRFFMYYEDMDYCLRVRNVGGVIAVAPHARMWHKIATSSGGHYSPNERYAMAKSSVLFFKKYALPWRWLFIVPWRLMSGVRMSFTLIKLQRWQSLIGYWKGIYHGLMSL